MDRQLRTLTLEEAAAFLHVHSVTLLRMAQAGQVPAAKPGKRWVFIDVDLADWLRAKYALRASGSGNANERKQKCHFSDAKTPRHGGLISPSMGDVPDSMWRYARYSSALLDGLGHYFPSASGETGQTVLDLNVHGGLLAVIDTRF